MRIFAPAGLVAVALGWVLSGAGVAKESLDISGFDGVLFGSGHNAALAVWGKHFSKLSVDFDPKQKQNVLAFSGRYGDYEKCTITCSFKQDLFYQAQVWINTPKSETNSRYLDLVTKLSTLYGGPDSEDVSWSQRASDEERAGKIPELFEKSRRDIVNEGKLSITHYWRSPNGNTICMLVNSRRDDCNEIDILYTSVEIEHRADLGDLRDSRM